jgi:hypothetical protein
MPRLTKLGDETANVLQCVRPFTPDIVSFIQSWGDFLSDGINNPRINLLHLLVSFEPWTNNNTLDMAQLQSLFPALKDDFPQAPGTGWGQPWYQPQCGITAANTNAGDDSLTGTYDPQGTKLIDYGATTTPVYGTTPTTDAARR